MDLGLNHLTEEERDRICFVIQRDEELRHKEQDRVRKLKTEVKRIRLKGVIKVGHDPAKTCARCRETFGWFFNKGQQCPQCQHKVCDNCRTVLIEDRRKWLCVLCYKQMELDAMSGQWFLQKFRKSKRNKKTNKVITGNDMVKASIYRKRHPSGSSGPEAGRGRANVPNDLRKSVSNNNSPKSVRSVGSASLEESSDTQSTASTSPGRLRSEVHEMGFPKESDKQKLLDLIRSKAPVMKSPEPPEDLQPQTVEVRRVSMSRYRSDSESSSSSDPSSPQLSARTTESVFTHSDSIRSSIRSSSAFSTVSAVSSDGRITVVTESCVSDMDSTSLNSIPDSPDVMAGRRSVTPEHMYNKQAGLFQSSDSVIENPAHKKPPASPTGIESLKADDIDGPVLIPQNKVTVQRVITRKQHDSLSSDSETEENTTEQITKVKFRRVSTGKGKSRSRSPSPDSVPVMSRMASDGPSSSEVRGVWAEVGQMESAAADSESGGEGQAGGGSNTAPLHAAAAVASATPVHFSGSTATSSSQSLSVAEAATSSSLLVRRSNNPCHMEAHGGSRSSGTRDVANKTLLTSSRDKDSTQDDGTAKDRSVRDKVDALLMKYRREGDGSPVTPYGVRDVNGWDSVPRRYPADDLEDEEDRASSSSYDIIESGKSSSFEDLEWDAETLLPNLPPDGSSSTHGEWEELQAAVEANMAVLNSTSSPASNYKAAMTRAHFLDDEVDGQGWGQPTYVNLDDGVGHVRFEGMRPPSGDDSSENLSVITEVTEPDEDFLSSEYGSPERALLTETVMAHGFPVSAEEFHKLTFQDQMNKVESNQAEHKQAMSRTESMRSSVDSDLCRKSITPSSDVEFNSETDLSLSQVSEASGTESTLDSISLELRHSMTILGMDDCLDQMLANVSDKNEVLAADFDQMYLHNLSFVDESEHEPLFCPVGLPRQQPIKTSFLPRKLDIVDGTVGKDEAKSDRKKRRHTHDPAALSAAFKGGSSDSKNVVEPLAHEQETPVESPLRAMRVSLSHTELLAVKVSDDPAVSPSLRQRRAELRSVAKNPSSRNRKSDPLDYGQVRLRKDSTPIDNSPVASISDLTKMFDKPLPWMNARVTELDSGSERSLDIDPDTESSERSPKTISKQNELDTLELENNNSMLSVKALQSSSFGVKSVPQQEILDKKSEKFSEVEEISLKIPEINEQLISPNNSRIEQKTVSKEINKKSSFKFSRKGKKEKQEKERLEREKKERQEQEKQEKERLEREKKERQELEKQEKKERKEREKREKQEKKDRKRGKESLVLSVSPEKGKPDKNEARDRKEQNAAAISPGAASLGEISPFHQRSVREQPFKSSKRSPSPTAKAVREKVETSKSVPVREIICEELEREILKDVGSTTVTPEKEFSVRSATSPLYTTASPTTRTQSSPTSNPSAEDVERIVEKQLDDWKKKRQQRRSNLGAELTATVASPHSDDGLLPGHAVHSERNLKVENSKNEEAIPGIAVESKVAEMRSVDQGDLNRTVEELYVQTARSVSNSTPERSEFNVNWQDEATREEELEISQSGEAVGGVYGAGRASSASPFAHPEDPYTMDHYDRWQTDDDDVQYADTEGTTDGTLTPDPDRDLDDTEIIEKTMSSTTDSRRFIEMEEEEQEDEEYSEEHLENADLAGSEGYLENESLSNTTGSIGRSSCDAGSTMGPLSVDTQDSASLHSSLRSSQYSPTSGSHVSGGEESELRDRNLRSQLLQSAAVSYDSLDVLIDEESDTAEERAFPEKVEEDFTLSLDLGPRPLAVDGRYVGNDSRGDRLINTGGGGGGGCGRVPSEHGGGGGNNGGGGERTQASPNQHDAMLHTKSPPAQSLPQPAKQHPDGPADPHQIASSGGTMTGESSQPDTSSLTESDAESSRLSSGVPDSCSSLHDRASNPSVPSINVSQDRELNVAGDRPMTRGAMSSPGSRREEEEEEEIDDIDELFAAHASPTHSSHTRSNLLSPFSGSRESIVSYYSDAGEGNYGNIPITGEILFALEYNYKTGALEVKVKQCRDIAPVDTKKKRSDPYVKTYLLPDKTKSGKRKTRVKKHTLSPVFDEVLKYSVTKSELETRTLWLTVWHSDMFGRNDFLGEVTVPLDYYTFDDPSPRWYKLQERPTLLEDENASPMSLLTYKGDLILSLRYITSENTSGSKTRAGGKKRSNIGELHVLLKEARNLTAVRANGSSDTFCKGYLLPDKARAAKQKTQVIKKECNPQWNHTFVFEDVTMDELRERSLELTVWDHDRFTSNDFLGGIRLNLGTGRNQGKDVEWMDAKGEEISVWQSMLDRPNCWIDANLMLRTNMTRRK